MTRTQEARLTRLEAIRLVEPHAAFDLEQGGERLLVRRLIVRHQHDRHADPGAAVDSADLESL